MKFVHTHIKETFILGISFSRNVNYRTKNKDTYLTLDLGSHSFTFILKGEY
jgi:hypothetical protein